MVEKRRCQDRSSRICPARLPMDCRDNDSAMPSSNRLAELGAWPLKLRTLHVVLVLVSLHSHPERGPLFFETDPFDFQFMGVSVCMFLQGAQKESHRLGPHPVPVGANDARLPRRHLHRLARGGPRPRQPSRRKRRRAAQSARPSRAGRARARGAFQSLSSFCWGYREILVRICWPWHGFLQMRAKTGLITFWSFKGVVTAQAEI